MENCTNCENYRGLDYQINVCDNCSLNQKHTNKWKPIKVYLWAIVNNNTNSIRSTYYNVQSAKQVAITLEGSFRVVKLEEF